jgi:hypothetical protein
MGMFSLQVIDRTALGCLMVVMHLAFAVLIWRLFRTEYTDRQRAKSWCMALVLNAMGMLILSFHWKDETLGPGMYMFAASLFFVSILQRAISLMGDLIVRQRLAWLALAFVTHISFMGLLVAMAFSRTSIMVAINIAHAGAALFLIWVCVKPNRSGNSFGTGLISIGYSVFALTYFVLAFFQSHSVGPSYTFVWQVEPGIRTLLLMPVFIGGVVTSVLSNMGFVWTLIGPFDSDVNHAQRFERLVQHFRGRHDPS